jgi:hypothetical protein
MRREHEVEGTAVQVPGADAVAPQSRLFWNQRLITGVFGKRNANAALSDHWHLAAEAMT